MFFFSMKMTILPHVKKSHLQSHPSKSQFEIWSLPFRETTGTLRMPRCPTAKLLSLRLVSLKVGKIRLTNALFVKRCCHHRIISQCISELTMRSSHLQTLTIQLVRPRSTTAVSVARCCRRSAHLIDTCWSILESDLFLANSAARPSQQMATCIDTRELTEQGIHILLWTIQPIT